MINKKTSEELSPKLEHQTLTIEEITEAAKSRVSLITKEFQDGFNFLYKYPRSVTIFGSARLKEESPYYMQAVSIGKKIIEDLGYAVITGGSLGIMEGANKGAFEAHGESIGLGIKLPFEQTLNKYLTDHLDFYYFFSRKVCLSFSAEAYIFLPGGFGTLDEFFEILTLVQTKKIEKIPIILVGSDFWSKFDELIKKEMLERKMIDEEDTWLYAITDNEEEIIDIIKRAPIRNGIKFVPDKSPSSLSTMKCIECEVDTKPLDEKSAKEMLKQTPGWQLSSDNKKITKKIEFKDFTEAILFVNEVGSLSEKEGHHPDISVSDYKYVDISLSTHNIRGLSENDFIMASKINEIKIPN